jgi:hypothetical protein
MSSLLFFSLEWDWEIIFLRLLTYELPHYHLFLPLDSIVCVINSQIQILCIEIICFTCWTLSKAAIKIANVCWWWYLAVIPALGRLRQKDCEFKASLGYIVRSCPKTKKKLIIIKGG